MQKAAMKSLSFIVILCMLLSLVVPVAASDIKRAETLDPIDVNIANIRLSNSSLDILELREDGYYLASQTLNDGNLCFYLLYNDQVLSYAYADMIMKRATTVVLASDGTTESITTMDVPTNPPSYDLQALPSSYTRAGGIEYLYGNGNNTRTADVGYRRTVTLEDYNLRGTYQTIAALAGFIATLCGFPGLLSSAVASYVVWACGLGSTIASFAIEDYTITSNIETVRWYASWRGNEGNPGIVEGREITVLYEDGTVSDEMHHDGNYFPISAFRSHNTVLASLLYESGFWGWDETTGYVNRWLS